MSETHDMYRKIRYNIELASWGTYLERDGLFVHHFTGHKGVEWEVYRLLDMVYE